MFQSHLQNLVTRQTLSNCFIPLIPSSLICKIKISRSGHTLLLAVRSSIVDNTCAIPDSKCPATLCWSSFPHQECPFPFPYGLPTLPISPRVSLLGAVLSLLYALTVFGWSYPCHGFDYDSCRLIFQIPTFCPDLSPKFQSHISLYSTSSLVLPHTHSESKAKLITSPPNLTLLLHRTLQWVALIPTRYSARSFSVFFNYLSLLTF